MCQSSIICSLLLSALIACTRHIESQTDPTAIQSTASYSISVTVDEVSLTFHAADAYGLPINDLKLNELHLRDNGKPPRRVLVFERLQNLPIRAGILMDTSQSMEETRSADRAIATNTRNNCYGSKPTRPLS